MTYENYREPGEFGEGATVRRAEPTHYRDREPTRPIVGIENRTAKEVFDIMCARIHAFNAQIKAEHACEIADMAMRFRAVNVERLSESLGADIFAMREKMDALEAALRKIAAYDDAAANAYLRATGSYRCFDEPGAVEMARGVLEGKP